MKKLLGIVVLGLLWCNVGFAKILKFDCERLDGSTTVTGMVYSIDTDTNEVIFDYFFKGEKKYYEAVILDVEGTRITYTFSDVNNVYQLDYGKGSFIDYQIKPKRKASIKCKSRAKAKKVEIASMIDQAKSTCKELGFTAGTEKFADCSLKLYSQSVELAAKQNQTVVMQPQSSGSNVMTIYDPVRDSNALIKQGQRMLSGACTLGIDC